MTQGLETVRIVYLGSGTPGPFAFNARVDASTEIAVEKWNADGVKTTLSYPTDYGLSGLGTNEVAVTLTDDLEVGEKIAIYRLASMVSTYDVNLGGSSRPISLEAQIDRLSRLTQDLKERLDRALMIDARGTAEGGVADGKGVRLANIDEATDADDAAPLSQIQALIATALDNVDGEDGEQGPAGTVTIGTVETLDPNTPAYVENVGTPEAAILNIGIPRGLQGISGSGTGDLLASNNLSDIGSPATAFDNIKQAATTSATGVVELATNAETTTGSDTVRATTPAGVKAAIDAAITALKNGVSSSYDTLAEIATALATFAVKSNNLSDLGSASTARTNLGLGTAAVLDVGTSANKVVQLDSSAKLPAVDGSQLTGITSVVKQTVTDMEWAFVNIGGNAIPLDNTVPQKTEGVEVLTVTITPTNASSRIRISFRILVGAKPPTEGPTSPGVAALFKDSDSNAIGAWIGSYDYLGYGSQIVGMVEFPAGSTDERTYKLRAAADGANPTYLNRGYIIAMFNGTSPSYMTAEELYP